MPIVRVREDRPGMPRSSPTAKKAPPILSTRTVDATRMPTPRTRETSTAYVGNGDPAFATLIADHPASAGGAQHQRDRDCDHDRRGAPTARTLRAGAARGNKPGSHRTSVASREHTTTCPRK